MNEVNEVCELKYGQLVEKLDKQEIAITEHTKEISELKQTNMEFKTQIKELCGKVDSLVTTLRWGIGLMVPTLVTLLGILIKK